MPGNNEDHLKRLNKDGRRDLLKRIEAGEMSVYAAAIEAGYRKRKPVSSRAQQISYHWTRADIHEKRRFLIENWKSLAPLVGDLTRRALAKSEAQKSD